MPGRLCKPFVLLAVLFLGIFVLSEVASAQAKGGLLLFSTKGPKKAEEKSTKELPEIPENLDHAKITEILAGLSDDQVRRLLIQELEKSAASSAKKEEKKEETSFAWVVQSVEENITLFRKRLTDLQSGAVAVPRFLPQAYADLRGKGGVSGILWMFVGTAILLAGGLGAEWLFGRYAADMRKRLTTSPPVHWTLKIKRLVLCSAIEFISICVFSIATLGLFFLFLTGGHLPGCSS